MHSTIFLLAALPTLISAHADPNDVYAGLPRFTGGRKFLANLKARNAFAGMPGSPVMVPEAHAARGASPAEGQLGSRQNPSTCGPGVGSCSAGYCCSSAGYCGVGIDYCAAPDCQFQYGPACDANTIPAGGSTSSIARTHLGSIPYGGDNVAGVQDCIEVDMMALTFDDGPYLYTSDLLDLLDKYNAKATFMITGNNLGKGEIDSCSTGYPQLIQRMHESGHQIASHTWSHQNFTALTQTEFYNQVYYNEMAFRNILGFFPTYLRPPYSECDSTCSSYLSTLGYHATYFDLDTQDYLNDSPTLIQNSKNFFTEAIAEYGTDPATSNFLVIGHDIHYQTVYNLTEFMLQTMAADGYGTSVTVGTCLGDPATNWYRSAGAPIVTCSYTASTGSTSSTSASSASASTKATTTTSTAKSTSTLPVSTDGTCGAASTCQGSTYGNCCSQYGYCGSTSAYCSTGCQPLYGTCGSSSSSSSSASKSTTPTTSSASKTSSSPKTSTSSAALTVSTDGSCGGTITCQGSTFGNCCSQYGWCGSTTDYCSTGCQAAFGTC